MIMLYSMPTNIIPFLVLGISTILFGLRGLYVYSVRKSPLSFYYGMISFLIGISQLLYSLPYFFTRTESVLKFTTISGDMFYYAAILVSAKLIWYLGFHKKISANIILVPYYITIAGCIIATYVSWPTTHYEVVNNQAYFPTSSLASWFFALMSSAFVFVGIITLRQLRVVNTKNQKFKLFLIGAAFLLGGLVAIYNFLFSQGSNTNSVGTLGYIIIATVLFAGVFVVSRSALRQQD